MPGICPDTRHFCDITYYGGGLRFADAEHLGSADGAGTLGGWVAVLHLDGFGVADFSLLATLDTIALHWVSLLFLLKA